MTQTVLIPARFNGPPASAHGGYACAMAAQFIEGAAEVTLRVPPPLETPLAVRAGDGLVRLVDGDTIVAEARSAEITLEVPDPVSVEQAEEAERRSPLHEHHPFDTCFVCGTAREHPDGVRLFPGPVEGRELSAAPWVPHPSLAGDEGEVRFEFAWSLLDCASFGGVSLHGATRPCVLARFSCDLLEPIESERPHVAIGWPIEKERRKRVTGAAIHSEDGTVRAVARALWIELTAEQVAAVGTTKA
jgi:hypothetical protein